MEEKEAQDFNDSNIELGNVQGSEEERSDGEMSNLSASKISGRNFLQASTN